MDFERILLLTLAGLGGCTSVWNCRPDSERFALDEDVTASLLDETRASWGVEDPAELSCAAVCQSAYRQQRGWESNSPETCSWTIDPAVDLATAEGDDVVGHVTCTGDGFEFYCEGRRPLGHVEVAGRPRSLAAHLVRCAHLEAVSVEAFEELAAQLAGWGAPASLVARCRAAAADERAHAALVRALVPGMVIPVGATREAPRALEDVARHNAVEGCVHEAWAALLAHLKADRAVDPAVRATYAAIAADEARHAQLSWDVHAWLMGLLDLPARDRVRAAQAEALRRLSTVARAQAAVAPAVLGLPSADEAARAASDFARRLAA